MSVSIGVLQSEEAAAVFEYGSLNRKDTTSTDNRQEATGKVVYSLLLRLMSCEPRTTGPCVTRRLPHRYGVKVV